MGGRTWENKDLILKALYEGSQSGALPTGTELAQAIERALSTVSWHLTGLARIGYVEELTSRKRWRITANGIAYLQSMQPERRSLEIRGLIAAGPALAINDQSEELPLGEFDPQTHFALRVRGTSMEEYGIPDHAVVICRKVSSWLDVPVGKIVVARVPEGTGGDEFDWLDQLAKATCPDGVSEPPLDHATLKVFDASFRSYLQQGEEHYRAHIWLKGSKKKFRAVAVAIDGYVVESRYRFE